jgi:hypothetical protein
MFQQPNRRSRGALVVIQQSTQARSIGARRRHDVDARLTRLAD